ncbi:MAG: hypothetical protein ACON4K_10185 [Akkermansiaceae bacterium]
MNTTKSMMAGAAIVAAQAAYGIEGTETTVPMEKKAFKKGGPDFRLFKPSLKVFFDTGSDDKGKIDIFSDGSLNASLDLVNFIYRNDTGLKFANAPEDAKLWWGPSLGLGITSPANDSADNIAQASDAPVLLLSAGLFVEYDFSESTSFLLESGYALGITSDESFGEKTDGAIFVGLSLDFKF